MPRKKSADVGKKEIEEIFDKFALELGLSRSDIAKKMKVTTNALNLWLSKGKISQESWHALSQLYLKELSKTGKTPLFNVQGHTTAFTKGSVKGLTAATDGELLDECRRRGWDVIIKVKQ